MPSPEFESAVRALSKQFAPCLILGGVLETRDAEQRAALSSSAHIEAEKHGEAVALLAAAKLACSIQVQQVADRLGGTTDQVIDMVEKVISESKFKSRLE